MFSQFISEKGVRALAIVFDVPIQTIYSWKRRNAVPRVRWDRLIEVYPEITYRRLREMEAASRLAVSA